MTSVLLNPSDILLVSDQQPLTLAFVNATLNTFIQAINNVLVRMDGYDAAEQNLVNLGLANINATLGPFLGTLQQAAQLGFLVAEVDGTPLSLQVGQPFECVLTSNGASLFTPTTWLMALDVNDNTNWGILQLVSWTQANLNLSTNCIYCTKTQVSSSWQVCCGSGVLNAMINDLNAATAAASQAQSSATTASQGAATVQSALSAIQQAGVVSINGKAGIISQLAEGDIANLVNDLTARPTSSYVNSQLAGLQPHSSNLDQLAALALSSFIIAFLGSASATAALNSLGAAPLASPAFSGTPTAPTATAGTNTTQLATTAFVAGGFQSTAGLAAAVGGLSINSSQVVAVFNNQSGNYTFGLSDYGKQVTITSSSAVTGTLPNSLPAGWNCLVWQGGAGQVTFSPASGATLRNRQNLVHTAGQYAMVSLMVMSNSTGTSAVYALGGDAA